MSSQPKKNKDIQQMKNPNLLAGGKSASCVQAFLGVLLVNQELPGTNPTDGQIQLLEHGISPAKNYKKRKLNRDIQRLI